MTNVSPMSDKTPPLYPIREVSKKTGVNSVTLRAWERRYSLITPQRTPSGHRLYSVEDIQRIERIVSWLKRGVPVGKVSSLLNTDQEQSHSDAPEEWVKYREQAHEAVRSFDVRALNDLISALMEQYHVSEVLDYFVLPTRDKLADRPRNVFGSRTELSFFNSQMLAKFSSLIKLDNMPANGATVVLSRLPYCNDDLGYLACKIALHEAGFVVTSTEEPIPLRELVIVTERTKADACILFGSVSQGLDVINLKNLASHCQGMVGVTGYVSLIRRQPIQQTGAVALHNKPSQAAQEISDALTRTVSMTPEPLMRREALGQ